MSDDQTPDPTPTPTDTPELTQRKLVASRVRAARTRAGYSQAQLASALGVTRAAIGNWELGARAPSPERLERISEITGAPVAYLLGEQWGSLEDPTPAQEPADAEATS